MINYVIGDATSLSANNDSDTLHVLPHIVNNVNGWGKGYVLSISKKWPIAERHYRKYYNDFRTAGGSIGSLLGSCQIVKVADNIAVANLFAQNGYSSKGSPAIDYNALETSLRSLDSAIKTMAKDLSFTKIDFHMPKIGTGLAGGDWNEIGCLIEIFLGAHKIYVYTLE